LSKQTLVKPSDALTGATRRGSGLQTTVKSRGGLGNMTRRGLGNMTRRTQTRSSACSPAGEPRWPSGRRRTPPRGPGSAGAKVFQPGAMCRRALAVTSDLLSVRGRGLVVKKYCMTPLYLVITCLAPAAGLSDHRSEGD